MTKPACKDCRFWNLDEATQEEKYIVSECRRRAPLALEQFRDWPRTTGCEWCGEFKPRDVVGTVDVDNLPDYDKAMSDASVRLRNMLDTLGIDGWSDFLEVFAKKSAPGFDPTSRSHITNVVLSQKNSGKTMARELIIRLEAIDWPFRKGS